MTGSKRYRLLSDEEVELWRLVAQTTVPRPGSTLPGLKRTAALAPPAPETPASKSATGPAQPFLPPYIPPQSKKRETPGSPPLAPLERQFRRRVVRGQIGIERAMDLHGLTQAEAHGAVRSFLRAAQGDGLRLVLVVTGKGQRARLSGDGHAEAGVLRRAVPHWLREPDLRTIVLGFEEASQPHGGGGALYIRLRQSRA